MDELPELLEGRNYAVYGESIILEGPDMFEREPGKTSEQRDKIFSAFRSLGAMEKLDDNTIIELIDFCKLRTFRKDEVVFHQGDLGNHFFVVEKGDFDVIQELNGKSSVVFTYHGSGVFGETSLFYANLRVATVQAKTEGLYIIHHELEQIVIDLHNFLLHSTGAQLWELERKVYRTYVARKSFRRTKFLESCILKTKEFKTLTPEELVKVADAMRPLKFAANQILYKQDDPVDGFYIVEEGTLDVTMTSPEGSDTKVGTLKTGDYFGNFELAKSIRRCSTVTTVTCGTVAFIPLHILVGLVGPLDQFFRRA